MSDFASAQLGNLSGGDPFWEMESIPEIPLDFVGRRGTKFQAPKTNRLRPWPILYGCPSKGSQMQPGRCTQPNSTASRGTSAKNKGQQKKEPSFLASPQKKSTNMNTNTNFSLKLLLLAQKPISIDTLLGEQFVELGTGCGHQFHHQNRLQHLIEDKAPVVQHLHPARQRLVRVWGVGGLGVGGAPPEGRIQTCQMKGSSPFNGFVNRVLHGFTQSRGVLFQKSWHVGAAPNPILRYCLCFLSYPMITRS